MKQKNVLFLTQAALIAALYVVLTEVSNIFGLASFAVQIRLSEVLTVLPLFTPAAIPGLFIGCIISNLIISANLFDIIFGSLATLLGGIFTGLFGVYYRKPRANTDHKKKNTWVAYLAPVPPIVFNTLIIPFILTYTYNLEPFWLFVLTVFLGEFISCGLIGLPFLFLLKKHAGQLFSTNK